MAELVLMAYGNVILYITSMVLIPSKLSCGLHCILINIYIHEGRTFGLIIA